MHYEIGDVSIDSDGNGHYKVSVLTHDLYGRVKAVPIPVVVRTFDEAVGLAMRLDADSHSFRRP